MLFLQYPPCSTCQKAKKWLDEAGIAYTDRHIKENNPSYEELKAWYKEEEETFQYPISAGACKAYRAWRYSDTDEVIMDDFTWERERHDFIDTLRKAGIQTLVVTNQSTGYPRRFLMREDSQSSNYLHSFQNKTSRIKNAYGNKVHQRISYHY